MGKRYSKGKVGLGHLMPGVGGDTNQGPRCKGCGKRRPWKRLGTVYREEGSDLMRDWICDVCGFICLTQNVSDIAIQLGTDKGD